MKKKLILILIAFSLLAAAGGAYLIMVIGRSADSFDTLIQLHEVEILREHLLLHVYQVQEDLYSQNGMNPESLDVVREHVRDMKDAVDTCFSCHHMPEVMDRLQDLQHQISRYSESVNRVLLQPVSRGELRRDQERAHTVGESLISKINTMIVLTNRKLNKKTEESMENLHHSKIIVIFLIVSGPLLVALLGFRTMTKVTKPIGTLLMATKRLKSGDLEHRIVGLHDEFGELALAFDDMAGSLRVHMQAIEASEKRYRLLFESAADAIFILDAEGQVGRIVQVNHAAVAMHGYTMDELLTMNISDLDSPDAALGLPVRIERLLAGERIQTEITHCRKDGKEFPVEVSAVLFEIGNHKYILAMDRDVTERKQAEKEIQRAQQIRLAGELATGLAHEIKNPLAGIMMAIEPLTEETCLDDEDRALMQKVIGEIKRIEALVNSLLNFARPPRPQFERTSVLSEFETAASLVLQRASSRAPERSIKLVLSSADGLPDVMADPAQLQQIFMNLLLNAVDAMPRGGVLTIRAAREENAPFVSLEVSDTGPGIEPSVMDRLFEPFISTKAKGTGLGLAITKRLIEEHGGAIRVENVPAGGARFTLRFPAVERSERAEG